LEVEAKKYLYDMRQAVERLTRFTSGKSFSDYQDDEMLRAAAERQFEIIGEALSQLRKLDDDAASKISEHHRIIAFRNILIHGYADVDARLVWDIIETRLATLQDEVAALLDEP
jgi:uncharacterized protein with HEPN domain